MNTADIAHLLRRQQEKAGLTAHGVAELVGCTVRQATQILAGDPSAPAGLLVRACEALGYELLAVAVLPLGAGATTPQASEPNGADGETIDRRSPIAFGLLAEKVHAAPEFDAPLRLEPESSLELWGEGDDEDHTDSEPAAQDRRREARRLALHQAAVRELRERPERAQQALAILERWLRMGFPDRHLAEEWRRIIESKDWDALLDTSERGKWLRKGSPVGCILDPQQRLTIVRRFARNGPSS